ncbi:hypothetical protein HMH01_13195 [Halovulum dunhuangense]|uniref:PH (Pleckstrin Homology) domain-containing protein n=1 Tax=Halovulum dunhuangense TaxID=1505036 RepID=A0A849L5D3_9RHOB|nr:hypothetical protein [Halovulum dunhuangense]NNU81392.1 hypothetical protein [Halovulum dunhuangense]
MSTRTNTPDLLEIELAIPRFILALVMLPVIPITLIGLLNLFSGEFVTALVLLAGFNGAFFLGYTAISERTNLSLDRTAGVVRIGRESRFGSRLDEYPLDALDSAELDRSHSSDKGQSTSKVFLVFRNTRPATRIPVSGWGVSGSGPGMIADEINDWLRQVAPPS